MTIKTALERMRIIFSSDGSRAHQPPSCKTYLLYTQPPPIETKKCRDLRKLGSQPGGLVIKECLQSTRSPSFLIRADHFGSSLAMSAPYSCGVEGSVSPPSATMRALTSGSSSVARNAALN